MQGRVGLFVFALLAAGCARLGSGVDAGAAGEGAHPTSMATSVLSSMQRGSQGGDVDPLRGFARLPDRGELLRYDAATVRRNGAYTWHRADISEAHALHALATGHLYVTTPDGQRLDFQYDRHVEHASGDWTWVGHVAGQPSEQAILTFGSDAAFGSIDQAGKLPLRMTVRDGVSWLVETDPLKLASINSAAAHPRRPDYRIVPKSELPRRTDAVQSSADGAVIDATASSATSLQAGSSGATTVDLLLGYTPGFATAYNGASGALTRLNFLVDVANAAYVNSQIGAQVRLVKAMQVNYTDGNSNETALEEMSGYKSGTGPVAPKAVFDGLRAAREQYGADLVSLVRDFQDPVQGGCGIAWLLGGSLQGIGPGEGWDELGYSVVSDRQPQGSGSYYCLDETLAHELGHNMGAAHDKDTAQGDDGVLDNPEDYGAYTFSFGYKAATTSGLYTIMSYGERYQHICRAFSSPDNTFCGSVSGSSSEDNARTLRQTISVVAGFRQTVNTARKFTRHDVNGDGRSDLIWRLDQPVTGNVEFWLMNGAARTDVISMSQGTSWTLAGTGDFNGDGKMDIVWTAPSVRKVTMSLSAGTGFKGYFVDTYGEGWALAGVGDVNGDGKSDLIWRYNQSVAGNVEFWLMDGATRAGVSRMSQGISWNLSQTGDFNGDGKMDIVWTAPSVRKVTMSLSSAAGFNGYLVGYYAKGWFLAGSGDINGDGLSDLIWRYNESTAGNVEFWLMNGATRTATTNMSQGISWNLSDTGDFNGDGKLDLVWTAPSVRKVTMSLSAGSGFNGYLIGTYGDGWALIDH